MIVRGSISWSMKILIRMMVDQQVLLGLTLGNSGVIVENFKHFTYLALASSQHALVYAKTTSFTYQARSKFLTYSQGKLSWTFPLGELATLWKIYFCHDESMSRNKKGRSTSTRIRTEMDNVLKKEKEGVIFITK